MKKKIYHENLCEANDLVTGNYYVFPSFILFGKNGVDFEEVKGRGHGIKESAV
jgi:hypothetical protein